MLFVSRRQGLCNLLLQDNRVHIIPHFKPAWLLRSIEEFRLPYSVISHSFAPWKLLTTQADICFCRALFGIKKLLLSLTMPQIDFSIDFSPISVWCDLATPKRPPTSHGRLLLQTALDRLYAPSYDSSQESLMYFLMKTFGLVDVWRELHSTTCDSTMLTIIAFAGLIMFLCTFITPLGEEKTIPASPWSDHDLLVALLGMACPSPLAH